MNLQDFVAEEHVQVNLKVGSKKQLLNDFAAIAAAALALDERDIFDTLLQRERLGSTGMGKGIAVPHGKLQKIDRVFGMVAILDEPVDFDSADGQLVDTVFVLLAPEDAGADHLKALSRIARIVKQPGVMEKVREVSTAHEVYATLTQATEQNPS